MSGGRFDYLQYRFTEIVDAIEQEIRDNNAEPRPKDWFEPNNFREETIETADNDTEFFALGFKFSCDFFHAFASERIESVY